MRLIIVVILALGAVNAWSQDVRVRGNVTKNGTYVQPHMRTSPDGKFSNNYSSEGNVNPYTGELGYKKPPQSQDSYWSLGSRTPYYEQDGVRYVILDDAALERAKEMAAHKAKVMREAVEYEISEKQKALRLGYSVDGMVDIDRYMPKTHSNGPIDISFKSSKTTTSAERIGR